MDSSNNHLSASSNLPSSIMATSSASANPTSSNNDQLNSDPEDLDLFVKDLMDNMQTRFSRLSDTVLGRIDDMGSKIDELEKNINELMEQTNAEVPPSDSLTTNNSAAVKRSGNDAEF